jgi:hypothetical protein
MKNLILLPILFLLSGCAIEKFNQPPTWASSISTHTRFFGVDASIPVASGATVGVKLGWGSVTWAVIPCSTNKVYAAPISDTFSLGQSINPFDTKITEDLQTGWEGSPPIPRYPKLFNPNSPTISTNPVCKKLTSPKEK